MEGIVVKIVKLVELFMDRALKKSAYISLDKSYTLICHQYLDPFHKECNISVIYFFSYQLYYGLVCADIIQPKVKIAKIRLVPIVNIAKIHTSGWYRLVNGFPNWKRKPDCRLQVDLWL